MPSKRSREPIFGDGALPFLIQLIGLGVAFTIVLAVAVLGIRSHATVGTALFGEQSTAPHLEPGESTIINGITIKRIN